LSAIATWRSFVATRLKLKRIMTRATSDYSFKSKHSALLSWKAFVKSFSTIALQSRIVALTDLLQNKSDDNKQLIKNLQQLQDR